MVCLHCCCCLPSWGNCLCMSVVPLSLLPCPTISLYNRFTLRTVQRPCFTPRPSIPGFPVRAPHPSSKDLALPPTVYIPHAPPPPLSLSTLHRHHAPSTPPTSCWGCPCSPRWHRRPPWPSRPPWGTSRRASRRAPWCWSPRC